MIPFDKDLLTNVHVYLKSCTTALGGSISVVDEERSTEDKEVYKKIPMPLAIARKFNQLHGMSRYLKPVLCSVTMYDGHAVAIERHPQGNNGKEMTEGLFGMKRWYSDSEKAIDEELLPLVEEGQWFTDGVFVYNFTPATGDTIINMSSDGKFKSIPVDAIKFADLAVPDMVLATHRRTCLDFTAEDGTRATSPPIWKQLTTVGDRQIDKHEDEKDEEDFQFDRIDEFLAVNLGFALKAAKELSDVFGYDAMEPLRLDELMIQLRTVNLPKTSKHVKRTYDTGLRFTHTIAWLIGLNSNIDTLESYKVLRSLLKYLTTKGVYHKTAMSEKAVYKTGMNEDDIPLLTIEEALENAEDLPDIGDPLVTRSTTAGSEHTSIGTLYGAE